MTHELSFDEALATLKALFDAKNDDYGRPGDPFYNLKASAEVGIAPWKYAWARCKEKIRRVDLYAQRGRLKNEQVEDSLLDIANCALLAYIMWREEHVLDQMLPRPKPETDG